MRIAYDRLYVANKQSVASPNICNWLSKCLIQKRTKSPNFSMVIFWRDTLTKTSSADHKESKLLWLEEKSLL